MTDMRFRFSGNVMPDENEKRVRRRSLKVSIAKPIDLPKSKARRLTRLRVGFLILSFQ